ncbi:NifU homolog involved in Fe-S cluster formation [Candidatus Terasakiella magnetica]|nr:NifU homolog involved in Fe-S cluster formation [Candidatus Terasakiella magnetica]
MSEIYDQAVKDLAAVEAVRLDAPDRSASQDNPLCGDKVILDLKVAEGRVTDLGRKVSGCLLCKAAATVLSSHAGGLDAAAASGLLDQTRAMLKEGAAPPFPDLAVFLPVRGHKSRHDCVLLPFKALVKALKI